MSLDISKLEHVRAHGRKITARCPACAEVGHDQKGEHLVINQDGRFGCVVYPGDSPDARAHRKRIFALCGGREVKPLVVHRPQESERLGRSGRPFQSHPENAPLKTGLLGRLGRVFETHLEPRDQEAGQGRLATGELNNRGEGVPGVLEPAVRLDSPLTESTTRELKDMIRQHKPALLDLMRLTFLVVRSGALDSIVFFVPDDPTKEALVSAGARPGSVYTRSELEKLVRQRVTPEDLVRIHAAKQIFNGKVTNS